jgi:hypothetical protein
MASVLTKNVDVMVSMAIAWMGLTKLDVFVKLVTSLALMELVLSTICFVTESKTVVMAKMNINVVSLSNFAFSLCIYVLHVITYHLITE